MAEPGDVLMPNSLPPELNNLIVVIFVCLFVLWTFRLCRNGLHLQDLRAGTSQNLLLRIDGIGPFMHTIQSLTRDHLRQFLRTQRNVPPTPVPRFQQPFCVNSVAVAPSTDESGASLPFGVVASFESTVPCVVHAFWSVDRGAVGALQRNGVKGLRQRATRKALEAQGAGVGKLSGAKGRFSKGKGAGGYLQLSEGKSSTGLDVADTAGAGAGAGAGVKTGGSGDFDETDTGLLFTPGTYLACSPPQPFMPGKELSVTVRVPLSLLNTPPEVLANSAAPPCKVPTPQGTGPAGKFADAKSGAAGAGAPSTSLRPNERRVPLLLVVQHAPSAAAAWLPTGDARGVRTRGSDAGAGHASTPTGTAGGFAGQATSSRGRAPRSKILYDVTALKFPFSAMYPSAEGQADQSEDTLLGPVPGSSGAGQSGTSVQDAASVATGRGGDGASQALLSGEGTLPGAPSTANDDTGAGAGAGNDEGDEGDSGEQSGGGETAVDLTVSKHWAVTFTACYQLKAVYGLRDGQECSVCLVNAKSVVLMPCRHMCVCETCFTHLDKCPVCRGPYTSHLTFREPVGVGGSDSDSSDASGRVRDAAVVPSAGAASGAAPTVVVVSSSGAASSQPQADTPLSGTSSVPPLAL